MGSRDRVELTVTFRLVHHAEVIVLKGESYRLKGKGKEVMASEAS